MKRWLGRLLLWSPVAVLVAIPFLPNAAFEYLATLPSWLVSSALPGFVLVVAGVAGWQAVRQRGRRLRASALVGAAVGATPGLAIAGLFVVLGSVVGRADAWSGVGSYLIVAGLMAACSAACGLVGGWLASRTCVWHASQ
jgi:uncharacterized membrane protein